MHPRQYIPKRFQIVHIFPLIISYNFISTECSLQPDPVSIAAAFLDNIKKIKLQPVPIDSDADRALCPHKAAMLLRLQPLILNDACDPPIAHSLPCLDREGTVVAQGWE